MKWIENYKLGAAETDINNIASVSAMLRYMQDSSNMQMKAMRPSYDELFEQGLSFVLSRIIISIYSPLRAHDKFEGETWAAPSKGVTINRCYRLTKDGSVVAEALSAWALLNVKEKRLCRVNESGIDYGEEPFLELDMPARFRIPAEAKLTLVGERMTEYADCDLNGHMNNTYSLDMLCDFIPDMHNKRILMLGINYVSEAVGSEVLKVYLAHNDGQYYIRTVRQDGTTNCEAIIMPENIRPVYNPEL